MGSPNAASFTDLAKVLPSKALFRLSALASASGSYRINASDHHHPRRNRPSRLFVFHLIITVKKSFLADFGGQMATLFVCRFGPCRLLPTPLSLLGRWSINSASPVFAPHLQLWLLIVWHVSTRPAVPRLLYPSDYGTLFFQQIAIFRQSPVLPIDTSRRPPTADGGASTGTGT